MTVNSSGISFSGLFSNLDTDSIIEQLMYIEAAPVRLLETQQSELEVEKGELKTNPSSREQQMQPLPREHTT